VPIDLDAVSTERSDQFFRERAGGHGAAEQPRRDADPRPRTVAKRINRLRYDGQPTAVFRR